MSYHDGTDPRPWPGPLPEPESWPGPTSELVAYVPVSRSLLDDIAGVRPAVDRALRRGLEDAAYVAVVGRSRWTEPLNLWRPWPLLARLDRLVDRLRRHP